MHVARNKKEEPYIEFVLPSDLSYFHLTAINDPILRGHDRMQWLAGLQWGFRTERWKSEILA